MSPSQIDLVADAVMINGAAPATFPVIAADIDSEVAASGDTLTANGAGGATWEPASGGTVTVADIDSESEPTDSVILSDGAGGAAWANIEQIILADAQAWLLLDATEVTSPVAVTGTSEGSATTIIASGSIALLAGDNIVVEYQCPSVQRGTTSLRLILLANSTVVSGGFLYVSGGADHPGGLSRIPYQIPSDGNYAFTVKAYVDAGTGYVTCGAGGTGAFDATTLRIYQQF